MIGDVAVMATVTNFYDPSLRPPVIPADKMFYDFEGRTPTLEDPTKRFGGWLEGHFFFGGGEQDIQNTWDLGATCMQVAPLPLPSRVITHNML